MSAIRILVFVFLVAAFSFQQLNGQILRAPSDKTSVPANTVESEFRNERRLTQTNAEEVYSSSQFIQASNQTNNPLRTPSFQPAERTQKQSLLQSGIETLTIQSYRRASKVEKLDRRGFPAGVVSRGSLPEARATDFEFNSVQLAEIQGWLNWFGLEIPVEIQGDLSGWIWVQRSAGGFLDFSGYRLEGGINSRSLTIDEWVVSSANLRFAYSNDNWYVGDLSGIVRSRTSGISIGSVELQALMSTATTAVSDRSGNSGGKVSVSGTVDDFSLLTLLASFGVELPASETRGAAEVAFQVPVNSISDLQSVTGWIELNSGELKVESYPAAKLAGRVFAESGSWIAPALTFTIASDLQSPSRSAIQLNGSGQTSGNFQFQSSFQSDGLESEILLASAQTELGLQGLLQLNGMIEGDAIAGIQKSDVEISSSAISLPQMQLSDIEIRGMLDRKSFPQLALQLAQTTILERSEAGVIPVGSAEGFVSWHQVEDVTEHLPAQTHLSIERLDLSRIPADVLPFPVAGTLRLLLDWQPRTDTNANEAPGDADVPRGLAAMSTSDWKLLTEISINGLAIQNVRLGDIGFRANKPRDSQLLAWSFADRQGTVQASGTANLKNTTTAESFEVADSNETTITDIPSNGSSSALSGFEIETYDVNGNFSQFVIPLSVVPELKGQFSLTGDFNARGAGLTIPETAEVNLSQLQADVNDLSLTLSDTSVVITPESIRLNQFTLNDAAGTISGSAILQREADRQHELNVSAEDLNLTPYLNSIANIPLAMQSANIRANLSKRSSAALEQDLTTLANWFGTASGNVSNVVYSGAPLGFIDFNVQIDDLAIQGTANGELLGGTVELEANLPATFLQPKPKRMQESAYPQRSEQGNQGSIRIDGDLDGDNDVRSVLPVSSVSALPISEAEQVHADQSDSAIVMKAAKSSGLRLSVVGLNLRRLMSLFTPERLARDYDGVISLGIDAQSSDFATNGWRRSTGSVRLNAPNLTYRRHVLTRGLAVDASWDDLSISIPQVRGSIAGGQIAVEGNLRFKETDEATIVFVPEGILNYSASRIDLQKLMFLIAPAYSDLISGRFSSRGQARCRDSISILGSSHLSDAVIYNLPIQRLRNDLHVTVGVDGSFEQFTAHRIRGEVVGGKAEGAVTIRGGNGWSLRSDLTIRNGKLEQLSRSLGFDHIVGSGGFDFVAALDGRDVFDLQTLQGPVQLDFRNSDAQSVPILTDLSRFVPLVQLANTDITGGFLHGQIGQGQLRILDVFLNSDAYMLMGSGSYGLLSGRLDLEAILQTGGGLEQQVAQSVSQRLVAVALPQLLLLTELNDLIRNRTLYFHIGGTAGQPVLQPRAIRTVGRAFLQNLRRRILVIPTTAAAVGTSSQ